MADAATTRNRLRKPEPGQYPNSWGPELNEDFGSDRLDQALDGMISFALSGNKTLSSTNYETDEARMRMVNITSGTGGVVTIPSVEKWYLALNQASGTVTFKTSGGVVTADVPAGSLTQVMCDGTKCFTQPLASYMLAAAASAAAALVSQNAAAASASGASTSAGTATTQAGVATTQAGISTAQAVIATTQAGISTTQASAAAASATAAAGSATTATTQAGIATTQASAAAASAVLAQAAATYQVSMAVTLWTDLAAITGSANQTAAVFGDAGTHTDPVVGGTVSNSGVFRYSTAPAGWQRVGELGGPYTQIGSTVNTTSGTSVSFTSIPTTYSDLLVIAEGVSHNSGSSQSIRIEVSDDGVNWTNAVSVSDSTFAAAGAQYGSISIPGYKQPAGAIISGISNLASNRTAVLALANVTWRVAAGIQAIRFSPSGGSFDAGTLKLFGR